MNSTAYTASPYPLGASLYDQVASILQGKRSRRLPSPELGKAPN